MLDRDEDKAWEYVAEYLCPAARYGDTTSARQRLAELITSHAEVSPARDVMMARMTSALMGTEWADEKIGLQKKVKTFKVFGRKFIVG